MSVFVAVKLPETLREEQSKFIFQMSAFLRMIDFFAVEFFGKVVFGKGSFVREAFRTGDRPRDLIETISYHAEDSTPLQFSSVNIDKEMEFVDECFWFRLGFLSKKMLGNAEPENLERCKQFIAKIRSKEASALYQLELLAGG